MSVSQEEVLHIAHLSRLSLTETETEEYATQLSKILDYAAHLNTLDTEGVPPTFHAVPNENILREDTPSPPLPLQDALKNSANSKGNFFVTPKVADGAT